MKNSNLLIYFLFISIVVNAQHSLVRNVPLVNIGPSIMSGRIVDFDVNPNNVNEFYAAYASGGLWYTNNNGTSFTPVIDNAETINIGDIAVDWNSGTIWVGTGENNSSRSSYSGIGILKSIDKGATWEHVGLPDSHHIGRIVINKNNSDEVVVGVIGHLYTANKERGIFKTKDGGKTWKQVLFIDENTGVIDISVAPTNPKVLYAASWERTRKAWNFDGDGKNSAIYKSTDSGSSWEKVTEGNNGFPQGDGVGRIGLAVFNENVVYALLDNQFRRPSEEKNKKEGLKKDHFKTMSKEAFLKLSNKELNNFLKENNFAKEYTAEGVKEMIKNDEITPSDLAFYLEDANSLLFDTPVIGAEVYKSGNGGKTWKKTHKEYLDDVYSSYGYYFGTIAINTSNQNKIYIGGVPLLTSNDGGNTFTFIGKENVHADHQALWINPNLKGHVINGNDGGINITYDDGKNWLKNNQPSVGQFYAINVDNKKPYNVFGGLQDNGVWYGPSNYKASKQWNSSGSYPYKRIGGGDGMQVQIDNRDNNIVYSGSQFGYYYRVNLKTKDYLSIHPKHKLGESPYRYNWQTPILLSPHNQDILYMGANKLLRSMDKGENFEVISNDLTNGGEKGNVPFGTLTSISESPFKFGFIYTGSDDGLVHVTINSGGTWKNITGELPQNLWVSRVLASKHKKERAYVALNGYRNDDFKPYLFLSDNTGMSWKSIIGNLPNSPINVIIEDVNDENVLYVGTDNGVYVTFNKGKSWELFSNGIPKVAVHDLVIQERENDLVIGTHGRSIYKTNITPLQHYNKVKEQQIAVFEVKPIKHSGRWGNSWSKWQKPTIPEVLFPYYVKNDGLFTIDILSEDGFKLESFKQQASEGFNYFTYNLVVLENSVKKHFNKKETTVKKAKNGNYYLPKGSYIIKISNQKTSEKQKFEIK